MLANGNWGGAMPPALGKLTKMELLMLQWHRLIRRRMLLKTDGKMPMPATFGNTIVAPCASAMERALQWNNGKICLPMRPGEVVPT